MIPRPFHGYHPDAADRVALIRVEPAADRDMRLVHVLRGPKRAKLRLMATLGPFSDDDLHIRFAAAVEELRHEGYWPGGVLALLEALDADDSGVRARAALRLGWRRSHEAVDKLLAILPESVDDCCSILDALGMIGDARAVPAVRGYAERKLLSRRRSAVEALRGLGDAEGLQQAQQRAAERLPESLRTLLDADASAPAIADAFLKLDAQQQAVALDTLYELDNLHELDTVAAVAAVQLVLAKIHFGQAYLWRAVKSVFKRSMLRHDLVTFGQLAHAIELQGRGNKGTSAHVKSGYDGSIRQMPIFSRTTQCYLHGLSWRYLRDLSRYIPEAYAAAAAEAMIHYTDEYLHKHGTHTCYLLHQILLGRSKRFSFEARRLRFRVRSHKKPPGVREEQLPELWDAHPRAYLRLLAAGRSSEVQAFAVEAIKNRHPQLMREAADAEILAMLGAPHEPTVELALAELDRRFNADKPDWNLLRQMLDDERPLSRTLGQRWLRLTAHLWLNDPERIIDFLGIQPPNIRALVVELTVSALEHQPALRQTLAERILPILRAPEAFEGAQGGYAAVAGQALAAEFARLVGVSELADWIASRPDTVKVAAGELLRQRGDAVRELGVERVAALAGHELVTVRAAAHALLRSAIPQLRTDPSVLFVLVESDWEDTRTLAFELLRDRIDLAALGLDGLMGLLDSNRTDVQDLGKELSQKQLHSLPADELVFRLVQHPHSNMRQFALDLAVQYLPENSQSLAQLRTFCRSALLDLWPNRRVKQSAFDFLAARGVEDPGQAAIAASILGDIVRTKTRSDAEHALEALVRIKLAQPEVPSTVELLPGSVQ